VSCHPRPTDAFVDESSRGLSGAAALHRGVELTAMDAVEVHRAADVERLTPDERQRLVDDHTCIDLSRVPADFVARARSEGRRLLIERGLITE
jgi:hypothetical protein